MTEVITKKFRAIELEDYGGLHYQIAETPDKFLKQHGLYIFKNPGEPNDSKLFFHYNEGTSGIIDRDSKTVKIKGLAGVINNTKRVLEAVSEGIELEEK